MNWGKLKSFLIGLFLIINIFLIVTMIVSEKSSTTIPKQTIQDTANILRKNSISVEESIIPNTVKNMEDITVKPITKSDDFLGKISGSDGIMFEMNFNEAVHTTTEMKKILSKGGIKGYNMEKEFSDGYGRISQVVRGYNIFDTTLDIESKENKTTVSGIWYDVQSYPKKASDNQNPVILPSILIDFISNTQRPLGEQEITDIKYGYYVLNSSTNAVLYTAVPCWMIEIDGVMNFYYNAANGEYIAMQNFQ